MTADFGKGLWYNGPTMQNILCKTDCIHGHGMKSKGLLVLRIVAGLIFVMHGWGKLTGNPSIEMFTGMLGGMGIPMPMFFAWMVALTEFLGGLALILGIFVRPAAVLLSIVMLVAVVVPWTIVSTSAGSISALVQSASTPSTTPIDWFLSVVGTLW